MNISVAMNEKKNTNTKSDIDIDALIYNNNRVCIGDAWAVKEPDILNADANLDVENKSVNWIVEPSADGTFGGTARGFVSLNVYKFNFVETGAKISAQFPIRYDTFFDYNLTVYDGETESAPVLASDHIPFMGGGIEFTKISSFIEVDTRGLPQRTLAYRATVTTQLYIPSLRLSIETPTGTKSVLGKIIINFISPTEAIERMKNESKTATTEKVTRERIDVDLGTVYFITPREHPNIPKSEFHLKNRTFIYHINESTTEVEFHVKLWYCSKLAEKPSLPYLKFLPCYLLLRMRATASTPEGNEVIIPHPYSPGEKGFRCRDWDEIEREPTPVYLNFTVNTTEYLSPITISIYYAMVNPLLEIIFGDKWAVESDSTIARIMLERS